MRYPDGHEQHHDLDPRTGLIDRTRDEHALHPGLDPDAERFERIYSERVTVAGVVYADLMVMTKLETGEERQRVRVLERVVNGPADPALLRRP